MAVCDMEVCGEPHEGAGANTEGYPEEHQKNPEAGRTQKEKNTRTPAPPHTPGCLFVGAGLLTVAAGYDFCSLN